MFTLPQGGSTAVGLPDASRFAAYYIIASRAKPGASSSIDTIGATGNIVILVDGNPTAYWTRYRVNCFKGQKKRHGSEQRQILTTRWFDLEYPVTADNDPVAKKVELN